MNRVLSTTSLPRQAPEARMNPWLDSMSQSTGLRRVAAAVRTPLPAICTLDAPRLPGAPQRRGDFRLSESQPAASQERPRNPLSHAARLYQGNEVWQAVLSLFAMIVCSSQLAYSIQVEYCPGCAQARSGQEARGAGANRITTASNRIKDQGYVASGCGPQHD